MTICWRTLVMGLGLGAVVALPFYLWVDDWRYSGRVWLPWRRGTTKGQWR